MKILIVGGAGAIGSYLAWQFGTIAGEEIGISEAWQDLTNSQIAWLEQNVRHFRSFSPALSTSFDLEAHEWQPDAIINAAGHSSTRAELREAWGANVILAEDAARLAISLDAPFVHLSSATVYGNGPLPMHEAQAAPDGDYGRTKYAGDRAVRHAFESVEAKTPFLILRLFNVQCVNEHHKGTALSPLFRMAIAAHIDPEANSRHELFQQAGKTIRRDFVSVRDVAGLIAGWLLKVNEGERFEGDVLNCGTGTMIGFEEALSIGAGLSYGGKFKPVLKVEDLEPRTGYQFETQASTELLRSVGLPIPLPLQQAGTLWTGDFERSHRDALLTRLYGEPGSYRKERREKDALLEAIGRVLGGERAH